MGALFKNCKTPGIRYREHSIRKHGRQKDRYFTIRYMLNQKRKEEGIGWASEGWTEQKANEILCILKENIRLGRQPQTLATMRKLNEEVNKETKKEQIAKISEVITLQEIFDRFIVIYKTEATEKTSRRVNGLYQNWIAEKLGNKKLIDITVNDIQTIITEALQTISPRSVDYIKSTLHLLFNYAKKHDLYFKDNPAGKVKVKLKDNKRNRFLTKEEARILLDSLMKRSVDLHDMALLSLYAGLRAGEIFNLKWERIIWNVDRISIADPKNGEGRMEPMHPIVKKMLLVRYEKEQTGYIFKSRNGDKIKDLSNTFQRTVDQLGFNDRITDPRQKVVFHTLRHTYASWLVMSGVDLYTTQKLMGHKSNQMTQRYAHLAPGYLEKAVNSLESI